MMYRGLQTDGLWLKLLPLLVLLTFSSSEARYALSHTLEQLFPAQVCVNACKAQTTPPKAAFVQQSAAIQGSSSLSNNPTETTSQVQTVRLEVKPNSVELARFVAQEAFPRAPPRVNWFQ